MSLKDRVVLITGGSEGLGKEIASELASAGGHIWIISRDPEKLKASVRDIGSSIGQVDYEVCDVRSAEQVDRCVRHILEQSERIDVLINNAGVWLQGDLEENSVQRIKEVINTNLLGVIFVTRAVLPIMKKQGGGQILNVNSDSGLDPNGDWPVYVASKYGLKGFSDSVEQSVQGTGIKVLSVYPGGMGTNLYSNAGLPYSKHEPWMMKPRNVAEVIRFILTAPAEVALDHVEIRKA